MQVPRYWREQGERYNLVGSTCGNCGHVMFPRRTLCTECRHLSAGKVQDKPLARTGTLETWTIVHQAPESHAIEAPYVLGIVKLDDGPRVTTQLVDVDRDELEVGLALEARFRKVGEGSHSGVIHYGYKFGPLTRGP